MKRYIANSSAGSDKYEYEDNLADEATVLADAADGGYYETWGDFTVWAGDVGIEYNHCIDNTTNEMLDESAFYKIYEDLETGEWDTSYSPAYHYEIDYSNPNWREAIKDFAFKLMDDVVREA